jgi:hypothetical protein
MEKRDAFMPARRPRDSKAPTPRREGKYEYSEISRAVTPVIYTPSCIPGRVIARQIRVGSTTGRDTRAKFLSCLSFFAFCNIDNRLALMYVGSCISRVLCGIKNPIEETRLPEAIIVPLIERYYLI